MILDRLSYRIDLGFISRFHSGIENGEPALFQVSTYICTSRYACTGHHPADQTMEGSEDEICLVPD